MYSAFDSYFVYLIFLPLIYLSIRLAKKTHWIFPIFVVVLYTVLMGFRDNVGIDWGQFKSAYNDMANNTSNVGRVYEPTYMAINYILAKVLHLHYTSLFVLQSALYIGAIFVFSRMCPNQRAAAVTCMLYYCISFFHAINTSRNFMAISIVLLGIYMLLSTDRRYWALALMVVGALCHYATIPLLCLFIVFYYYRPQPKFYVLLLIYLGIFLVLNIQLDRFVGYFYDRMSWLAAATGEQRFTTYMDRDFLSSSSEHHHTLSMMRTYFFVLLNIWFLYLAAKKYPTLTSTNYKIIYWCAIVYVLITNSFQSNELLFRFTYIFEPMFCFVIGDFLISYVIYVPKVVAEVGPESLALFTHQEKPRMSTYRLYAIIYVWLMIYQFVVDINTKLTGHGTYFYYRLMDNIDRIFI